MITAVFSMRSFGFCVPALLGGICRPIMGTGRIPTAGSVDGETKGVGNAYWNGGWMTLIMSG